MSSCTTAHTHGDVELHLKVKEEDIAPPATAPAPAPLSSSKLRYWRWWLIVAINVFFLLAGQTVATVLGRFYYNEGGNSKWMATLVQSAGFPALFIPLLVYASPRPAAAVADQPSAVKVALIYVVLGIIIAGDNLMYSYGLLYLPVSTYSLICATQLAFNAVFAFFLNGQKFTALIFNSVVLLTFSAALLGVESDNSGGAPEGKYPLGFALTLGASATYSLILSLMQLTFQRVLRKETFAVVLQMQVCTSAVATAVSVLGLFVSGEHSGLRGEMEGYKKGRVSYVMTLVWTAVGWQVASVGVVGLVFVASSLFSNVVSTLGLPLVPVFAVIFFGDKMQGVKIIALLIAVWGFASYIYQHYLDDRKANKSANSHEAGTEQ